MHRTGSRSTDARAAGSNSKYRVFMARIDRVGGLQQAREETHARGYAGGWTVSVHCHHQGLRPRYPLWSYRHVHTAAVEVRRVKRSNAVELEEQPKKVRARIVNHDRLRQSLSTCPVAIPNATRIEGLGGTSRDRKQASRCCAESAYEPSKCPRYPHPPQPPNSPQKVVRLPGTPRCR